MLVKKLLADFHLREQRCLVQILQGTRPFMFPRLLQVNTTAGTVERNLALFATTLRADPSMDRGTKAFLFSLFADCTRHEYELLKSLSHADGHFLGEPGSHSEARQSCSGESRPARLKREKTRYLWAFEVPK